MKSSVSRWPKLIVAWQKRCLTNPADVLCVLAPYSIVPDRRQFMRLVWTSAVVTVSFYGSRWFNFILMSHFRGLFKNVYHHRLPFAPMRPNATFDNFVHDEMRYFVAYRLIYELLTIKRKEFLVKSYLFYKALFTTQRS